MKLQDLDNNHTDKNSIHSYLDLYEKLLCNKRLTAKNVLEVGIGPAHINSPGTVGNGGSIKLWCNYFENAVVYALDIIEEDKVWSEIKNNSRIKLLTSCDAYDDSFFKKTFLDNDIKFDMLLDDGPHTLESMKKFIKLYSQIISDDGILIIEDIQDIKWLDILKNEVSENLKQYIETYDLRNIKNRYDDIVFVINKSKDCNQALRPFHFICSSKV
jgi:hypothetical protein